MQTIQPYALPILVIGFMSWRVIRFRIVRKKLPEFLKQGAVIVDVRSPNEFSSGATPGSLNLPLNELDRILTQKKVSLDPSRPVIVCCASGTRSGMAMGIFKKHGFDRVMNAGPWQNTLPH